jgi:2-haloacid dehalogenase
VNRRDFLKNIGLGAAGFTLARAQQGGFDVTSVKALVFDTFGTIVDWRGSIIAEGEQWGKSKGIRIDWARFADRWRAGYGPSMDKVRKGEIPWIKLDGLHRMILEQVLKEFSIEGLSEPEKERWNRVWHRLNPWPDCVEGLTRLKKKYTIAPLSNGNIGLMTDLAKHSGLPWDAILGAELVHHYKPDREVYISAPEFLGLDPGQVMMVAAHIGDLHAAGACGLRTGFIHRPNEFGPGGKADNAKTGDFDIVSSDTIDLAKKLGA